MSLATYKKKRSFNKTPEPAGKKASTKGKLHFVIQKHDATRLHYDFRLEMEGVLKSWAVPKGPSLNPADKRLAMMVEDHPYEYKDFEGIIPEGNYGAGTVIIWDEGTYDPGEPEPGKDPEKTLLHQLHKGAVKVVLHGKKLKGKFALVHIHGREENAWLLIKDRDEYASRTVDITKKDKSVKSGWTIAKMARQSTDTWESNKKATVSKKKKSTVKADTPATKKSRPAAKKATRAVKKKVPAAISDLIKKGVKSSAPKNITPMLATLADNAFNDKDWLYEIKWDGYRALTWLQNGKTDIRSRKNISFNEKFFPVAQAMEDWDFTAILDGEIVCINDKGKSDFQQLQQWQKTGEGELVYYVFDLLWINGYNITGLPLLERKEILKAILPAGDIVRYSDHVKEKGDDFFQVAVREGLEGIMAKNAESAYSPGVRTKQWLKIKTHLRQEVVIAGFTEPRKSRKYFGALVLGVYEKDELIYIGHTGTGFNEKLQADLYKKLEKLISKTCPFPKKPKTNMPVTWVKPQLVCEIEFSEWTREGIMRIPVFLGLREDKDAKDVKREKSIIADPAIIEEEQPSTMPVKKAPAKKTKTNKPASKKPGAKSLLNDTDKEQVLIINKKELTFTNTDKVYWPKEKITKRDMLNYYHDVAPFIVPYLKDRPQSLNRLPNGITKPGFYQKDVTGKVPSWMKTFDYISESDGELKKFLVCTDEAALLYMANLACIEMNPWHSRVNTPDNPDWCVIDLDPGKNSFEKVIETALVVKQVTDSAGIETFCKTSGSTGIHIYIPLGAKYSYDQSRQLAELIVTMVNREIPSITSLERSPAKRNGKLYLDYLQNRHIQTIASPYSLRPKPGATASAPLHWEEVKKGLSMHDFTINNMADRIKEVGDIFKPVLGKGIDLKAALKKITF